MAELGRILVILHGASAPSEAMLKKWSAAGEFRSCRVPDAAPEASGETGGKTTHARPGRPGLQLVTDQAIARVYELWPQLADSDPKAIFEQAVARTARQLASAIAPLVQHKPAAPPAAPATPAQLGTSAAVSDWQQRMEQVMVTLAQDVKDLRREMAQFAAMRNNLITRLDEVVARSRESLLAAGRMDGGSDPIVEARRDRDMGVIKSTMEQIIAALERLEGQPPR